MSDNSGISVGEYGIRSCIMESVGQHKCWDEKNDPEWLGFGSGDDVWAVYRN